MPNQDRWLCHTKEPGYYAIDLNTIFNTIVINHFVMPVIRTTLVFRNRKWCKVYQDIAEPDLNAYHSYVSFFAHHSVDPITDFEVVQLPDNSREAMWFRSKRK